MLPLCSSAPFRSAADPRRRAPRPLPVGRAHGAAGPRRGGILTPRPRKHADLTTRTESTPMNQPIIDLIAEDLDLESLPDGDSLAMWSGFSCLSSASCPFSSYSSLSPFGA